MSTVSGVNSSQNQPFVELVNKPQTSYSQISQQVPMPIQQQPETDVYEGPVQEKKKGSVLGKILTTLVIAGAAIGLNRIAHNNKWIKTAAEDSEKFADKYIKKPLNRVDDYVVKTWEKVFKKGAKAEAPAASEGGE